MLEIKKENIQFNSLVKIECQVVFFFFTCKSACVCVCLWQRGEELWRKATETQPEGVCAVSGLHLSHCLHINTTNDKTDIEKHVCLKSLMQNMSIQDKDKYCTKQKRRS